MMNMGHCERGDECKYAHDRSELQSEFGPYGGGGEGHPLTWVCRVPPDLRSTQPHVELQNSHVSGEIEHGRLPTWNLLPLCSLSHGASTTFGRRRRFRPPRGREHAAVRSWTSTRTAASGPFSAAFEPPIQDKFVSKLHGYGQLRASRRVHIRPRTGRSQTGPTSRGWTTIGRYGPRPVGPPGPRNPTSITIPRILAHGVRNRYKTAMCKFIPNCQNGANCVYAHSPEELSRPTGASVPYGAAGADGFNGGGPTLKREPSEETAPKPRCAPISLGTTFAKFGIQCSFAHGVHELQDHWKQTPTGHVTN
ncbi:hypothetical protein TCAL_14905 [Tigriopus californicus]|uniref:C3H1-type domain-containing protein n=1 Tax=Tigriopus californicus TaxID=6832 RepID=A0A553P420_TIGCA|nr:hypothetical protein TCAL_14905 [Tigriopus californicus]